MYFKGLGEMFPTLIELRNLASIPPRTDLFKFGVSNTVSVSVSDGPPAQSTKGRLSSPGLGSWDPGAPLNFEGGRSLFLAHYWFMGDQFP